MTTTYTVHEVKHQTGKQARAQRDAEVLLFAEAEAMAIAKFSRWYIVETVETDLFIERNVVARSPAPEPAPYLQRATPKISRLERARARMAKGVQS